MKSGGSDVGSVPTTPGYESYPFGNKVNARFYYDAGAVPANPELLEPANSKIKTDLNSVLKFSLGTNTTFYDLFFGTNQSSLVKVVDNETVTLPGEFTYTPSTLLLPNTAYYWKVIAKNSTSTTESSVFTFKTQEIISQFPYLQNFEDYWISNLDPLHPDTLNSVINTNYPDQTPWSWDNNWGTSEGSLNNYNGLFSAYVSAFSDGQYSLTTPRIILPTSMRINFWWRNGNIIQSKTSNNDTTYFEVSKDGKSTWKTLLKLCSATNMINYDNVLADLSEFAGDNVYLRWRYKRFSSSASKFFVDNIKIEAKPTGAIIQLDKPELNYSNIAVSGKTKQRVIIYNIGVGDLVINGITTDGPFTCNFSKTITPNSKDTAYVYFSPTLEGSYNNTVTFNIVGATGNGSLICKGIANARVDKFFQNFDAVKAIPAGWVAIQSSKSNNIVQNIFPVSYVSDVYSSPNAIKMVRINDSDTLDPVILVAPGVSGFATNQLSFYARKGDVSYGLELIVGVMDDPKDASTFVAKQTVTLTENYEQYTVKFKSNTVQPYIAFKYGEWTPRKPFPYTSIRIEDVAWEADLATPPAAAQIGSPIDAAEKVDIMSGLKIRWAAGSANTDGYKLFVGTTSNNCNEIVNNIEISKDQPNHTIDFSKLAYNTKYYWKVVPYNENGGCTESVTWSFTTMPDPLVTSFPFAENFDNTPNITGEFDKPLGWNIQDVFGDRSSWDIINYPPAAQGFTHNDSKGCIAVAFHPFNPKNDWLYTPPMQLKKNYRYDVEFYIHTLMDYSSGSFYKEQISLWAGTGRINSAMTDSLTYAVVNDNDWKKVTTSFKPSQDGVYYFGFHAISEANQYVLIVDDVNITETNTTGIDNSNLGKGLRIYPNPANEYITVELSLETKGVAIITLTDIVGKVVLQENLNETKIINLSRLSKGLYILNAKVDGKTHSCKLIVK